MPAVIVLVGLFVIGVVASLVVPLYWAQPAVRPAPVQDLPEPWRPVEGPLVRGLTLPDQPQSLAWAPDANQLAWTTFDAERSVPVVTSVGVGEAGFSATQELEVAPPWLSQPVPSVVTAKVDNDVVVLRWASGPRRGETAGVVDLRGLLGLRDARSPAVVTFGPTTRLAVIARLPAEGARPSLHVFDVTELVQPPQRVPGPGEPAR